MIFLLMLSLSACAGDTDTADLVVYGTIYTAEDDNDGLAEAFAVKDGEYIYVGDKEGVKQFIKEGTTEIIDREGEGLIIPGCTEGHSAVCNTTALKIAGILDKPEVRGGEVGLDKDGKPSGYVSDQAVFYVLDKAISKPLTDEQYKNACIYGMNKLLELGYTNALDAVTNMYHPIGLYEAIKKWMMTEN